MDATSWWSQKSWSSFESYSSWDIQIQKHNWVELVLLYQTLCMTQLKLPNGYQRPPAVCSFLVIGLPFWIIMCKKYTNPILILDQMRPPIILISWTRWQWETTRLTKNTPKSSSITCSDQWSVKMIPTDLSSITMQSQPLVIGVLQFSEKLYYQNGGRLINHHF